MRTLLLLLVAIASTTLYAAEPAAISVTLTDGRAVELSPAALLNLPKQSVSATSHGKTARYDGYDLRAVLNAAGVAPVESLRGKQLRTYVIVTASDGYEVVFTLAELDRTLGNTLVLLSNLEDGRALADSDGPWRLVVPGDQRSARWVRQIVSIRVVIGPR